MPCCLVTIFSAAFSRLAILVWYFTGRDSMEQAFKNLALPGISIPTWLWGLAGFLILPWTTLAYLIVFPGGISGGEWVVLVLALLIDLGGHGGTYRNRHRTYRRRR
jgi:hypothetical protein